MSGVSGGGDAGVALRGVVGSLVGRWWVVLVSGLVVGLVAFGWSSSRDEVFVSEARILYGAAALTGAALNVNQQVVDPEREAATNIDVAGSAEVASGVKEALGLREGLSEIRSGLEISVEGSADVLVFSYSSSDRVRARRLAQGFADEYRDFRAAAVKQSADEQIAEYRKQLQGLPPEAVERDTVQDQLNRLRGLSSLASSDSQIIERAALADGPVSPRPVRDGLLGLLGGLLLGGLLALGLDAFDRRVRSVEEFERLYGLRALASIPQVSFSARNQEERALGFEPYRVLRNALGFVELTQDLDVLMVTSAMPSEGKSSVAINLARTFALAGQHVVLVECDLRRPTLAKSLKLGDPGGGLTTALVGRRPVGELLVAVGQGMTNFSVLPSGPLPPNAAEMLRSPRMGELLEELKADGARVILDAPPLLPVADAQGLLDHPQIDGAVFVARAFQTTQDQARRARAVLSQHRLQPLGLVITGLKEEKDYASYGHHPGGVERTVIAADLAAPAPAPDTPKRATGARRAR